MKHLIASLKINVLTLSMGLLLSASITMLPSCSPTIDLKGTENVTKIISKLPALMEKAVEPYSKHEAEVTALTSELSDAVAHAASVKRNKEIAESWKILQNDLVAPFMARWKEKGKLDKDFVKEAAATVTKSLEAIKNAERAKKK